MQGLQGTQWNSPVSDEQAAALARQFPNRRQASSDPDMQVKQIVTFMHELVAHSLNDPIIGQAWNDAWQRFRFITNGDEAMCCWWYAKTMVKFVHHQEMLRDWLYKLGDIQFLISPEALLKFQRPKGDCAIFTTLIEALLSFRGIPWETVTVAVNPRVPEEFTHVYPQAVRPDGSRLPLDASHGTYPGWEAPASRVLKKKCGTPTAMKFIPQVAVN